MLDRFQSYLLSVNMSDNTIISYVRDCRQFQEFIGSRDMEFKDVDQGHLLEFLEYLTAKGLKSSTRRRKMEALRTFYRAMQRLGKLEQDPFHGFHDMPRVKGGNMRALTEMEYRSLRDVVRGSSRKSGIRDYAILELALQTGLRISEICSLCTPDIHFSRKTTVGFITVRRGKGGKERLVTLNQTAERAIREYQAMRPRNAEHKELFLSNRLTPCGPLTIAAVFKRYMGKAGIENATFHTLRHTFATHMLKKGTNIIVVQEALGHKSLTTTQKYLHFVREMMDEQMTKNAL